MEEGMLTSLWFFFYSTASHVYFTDRYEQEMVEWLRENMDIFDDDDDEDDSVEEEDCEVAKDDADDPSENNDIKIEPHLR